MAGPAIISEYLQRLEKTSVKAAHIAFLGIPFSMMDPREAMALIACRHPGTRFEYVVTPNVDHVVRAHHTGAEGFELYQGAWMSLCDSRILALLAASVGISMPVMAGSDVTASLFGEIIKPEDQITIIGCKESTIRTLSERYPMLKIAHHNPPMGFISNPAAVAETLEFMRAHPSRFVFLAVGSPQQEILASLAVSSGGITGLGLCVGNAISFAAMPNTRAPLWMRRLNLEWLHRLLAEPHRLWRRYLVEDTCIFKIFLKALATGKLSWRSSM